MSCGCGPKEQKNPLVGIAGVMVRRVANGYVVSPCNDYSSGASELKNMMACETFDRLIGVLREAITD